eukprot:gb/GFBE01019683.1/.p1 GENE.gb/GFBE01019683.1/~~gb/GFBE01019683.1/.p1  ORF type:complete len:310 (+),score=69.68 gb/GFBE01019683.1/:1-930(+)
MTPESMNPDATMAEHHMHMHDASSGNPTIMGVVCGMLNVVSPDHLVMLITFSTLLDPLVAAKVGAAWGVGHSAGVIILCCLGLALGQLIPKELLESWEHFGDYFVGLSLIFVAAYFIYKESQFLLMGADGTVRMAGCACHGAPGHHGEPGEGSKKPRDKSPGNGKKTGKQFCASFMSGPGDEENPVETQPLLGQEGEDQGRDFKGGLIGLVQGVCCPMGLVTVSYLPGQGASGVLMFTLANILITVLAAAALACLWAAFTSSSFTSHVSARFMYRGSCYVALGLGFVWILANYMHVLDKINYAEHSHKM